jgi:phosphoribosylanthranilate isomerase
MRTRIKICCIASKQEAQMAIAAGADAIGLVGKMPSGPGPIEDELIEEIARSIPPPIASFLLTSEQSSSGIINHVKKVHTNTVQLVDELTEGSYQLIRESLPQLRIVQVIHVTGKNSVVSAIHAAKFADALLLDSGNPLAVVKTLGGTGNVHDWNISREIVNSVSIPVFLAGGLKPDNVVEAIRIVRPFGVDVCSGVRTNGKLDEQKLNAFIHSVIQKE